MPPIPLKLKIKPRIRLRTQTEIADQAEYISIDVAIKNLAYCIMTKEGKPLEWKIINLAEGSNKLFCKHKLKSNDKICNKKAFYCHHTKSKTGICSIHYKSLDESEKKNYIRNITINNTSEHELISTLYNVLDDIAMIKNIKCALIERQPIKARDKIKHVSYALFCYFISKNIQTVKFVDAKNKLTLYDGPPLSCHLKTQYSRNKWYAEKYCEYILKQHGYLQSEKIFNSHKKKDDLADCFLQGLWYIKYGQYGKRPPITSMHQKLVYKENNIIKYKKNRPYKPSAKIEKIGKYSLSNIKYMILKQIDPQENPKLKKSIEFYFGDVDYFLSNN
jgi:hypothetical protein